MEIDLVVIICKAHLDVWGDDITDKDTYLKVEDIKIEVVLGSRIDVE
jgi:hypothetical protein